MTYDIQENIICPLPPRYGLQHNETNRLQRNLVLSLFVPLCINYISGEWILSGILMVLDPYQRSTKYV